jgi:hypothetical protein
MAYCSTTEVAAEFKNITFGSSNGITTAEVSSMIDQISAEIDGRLSGIYAVPITGASSLLIVKQLAVWLVKDRINGILNVKDGDGKDDQVGSATLGDKARKILDQILARAIDLPDAPITVSSDGIKDYNFANSIDHLFKRDTTQW